MSFFFKSLSKKKNQVRRSLAFHPRTAPRSRDCFSAYARIRNSEISLQLIFHYSEVSAGRKQQISNSIVINQKLTTKLNLIWIWYRHTDGCQNFPLFPLKKSPFLARMEPSVSLRQIGDETSKNNNYGRFLTKHCTCPKLSLPTAKGHRFSYTKLACPISLSVPSSPYLLFFCFRFFVCVLLAASALAALFPSSFLVTFMTLLMPLRAAALRSALRFRSFLSNGQ